MAWTDRQEGVFSDRGRWISFEAQAGLVGVRIGCEVGESGTNPLIAGTNPGFWGTKPGGTVFHCGVLLFSGGASGMQVGKEAE